MQGTDKKTLVMQKTASMHDMAIIRAAFLLEEAQFVEQKLRW